MTRFLQSGRRRDMCALLAGRRLQAQALKSRLESHYDERIDPRSFYAALESLEDSGFIERHEEGIHEAYGLTEAGEQRLRDHYEWLSEQLEQQRG